MSQKHEFETAVRWRGGREGSLIAPGCPELTVTPPPEFGGDVAVWTPEHFFVASAEACIMMTFLAISEFSKLRIRAWESRARGTVAKLDGEGFRFTGIEVTIRVEVEGESDIQRAERIVRKAEAACLVSGSMRCSVRIEAEITANETASSSGR